MTTINIFAYNAASAGAKVLADEMGIKRIRAEGSKYRGNPAKIVINWGCGGQLPPHVQGSTIINRPEAVRGVSNKLEFFKKCAANGAPRIPEFTTSRLTAVEWAGAGSKAVARTVLNGHSGEGIVVIDNENGLDIPDAPLYTKYVPKKEEWRIHVMKRGDELKVIDMQRKIRDPAYEGTPDWNVRSHANGFIFAREVAPPNPDVLTQALKALEVSGLDFGAIDVIWNQQNGAAYVLEINSAPGLVGTTVQSYAQAFKELFNAA